jgi:transposase
VRGTDKQQVTMLSLVTPDKRVPADHPLRRIKALADQALAALSPTFDQMYSKVGRPSIPPERLLKGTLLMAFYSIRSERLLCEQIDYNLLYRWFLDMDMSEDGIDHSTFSRNRARLLEHEVAAKFLAEVGFYLSLGSFVHMPAVSSNGNVYVSAWRGSNSLISAYDNEGSLLWTYGTTNIVPSVALAPNGNLVCQSFLDGGSVFALTPGGKLAWSVPMPTYHINAPAIDSYGTVYAVQGTSASKYFLTAISCDGVQLWRVGLTGEASDHPDVSPLRNASRNAG